jgi:hypothetical protein
LTTTPTLARGKNLEAIFTGKKGGPGAVLGSLVTKWLPTETAPIVVDTGDNPSITVGAVGHVKLQRIKDEGGRAGPAAGR